MPSRNIILIHGTLSSPQNNWFPWLRSYLEKAGHCVASPQFPTPENQTFDSWLDVATNAMTGWTASDTIIIGHSTGAIMVLRLAELTKTPYRGVISVCPFIEDLGLEPYDTVNHSFAHHDFDWERIRRSHVHCFAGDNDPYVPLKLSQNVAEAAHAPLTVVPGGQHLNSEAGYLEFPALLPVLNEMTI